MFVLLLLSGSVDQMLRLLKNLSGTDVSQPGSLGLRQLGSSMNQISNDLAEIISRSDVLKNCNFIFID